MADKVHWAARYKKWSRKVGLRELTRVSKPANDEKTIREKLMAKRNVLFQKFLVNPREIKLAVEIKSVDDQIAESTQRSRMGGEQHGTRGEERFSKSQKALQELRKKYF